MTREEAIKSLKNIVEYWTYKPTEVEAAKMAIDALRPVSREQVEKVWSGCYMCDEYRYFMFNAWKDPNSSKRPDCMGTSMFCPNCGKPLTGAAVEITMRRLGGDNNG